MSMRSMVYLIVGVLAGLLAGCSSATPVASMPEEYPRLPTASTYGSVWAEGRFYTNHDEIFTANLMEIGVVPVALRVFSSGDEAAKEGSRVVVEDIQPLLYLPDGTQLSLVPYDRIEVARNVEDRIAERALDINVVKPEAQSKEGFIFFRLPSTGFRVEDTDTLVHQGRPLSQKLRVSDSLLSLQYLTDDGARPIYVGLRKDRYVGDR